MACAVWLLLAAGGMYSLTEYEVRPGPSAVAATSWRGDLPRAASRSTLVMFVHPRCPCSRSSVEELARIMAGAGDRVEARVLFFRPITEPDAWAHTDIWRAAAAIPGVSVACDVEGARAEQFGAITSGHTMLYDASGALQFSGGITAARGHVGDNAGKAAVLALIQRPTTTTGTVIPQTPVFGCSIASLTPTETTQER